MEKKYSDSKYFTNLGKKIGVKINWIQTESGKQILLDDKYLNLIKESNYYKNKAVLDKYIFCAKSNEIYENSFLLTDILDMDPRLHISEFKIIWIESLKLALPSNLGESGREKFYQILHYLASKEETDFRTPRISKACFNDVGPQFTSDDCFITLTVDLPIVNLSY